MLRWKLVSKQVFGPRRQSTGYARVDALTTCRVDVDGRWSSLAHQGEGNSSRRARDVVNH